jgi:DNA invertase Pin-like site-specific DNA recombinase
MTAASLPIAYSYVRFSDKKQSQGDSKRRQQEGARDWCKRNGIRLDESLTFHDLGRSAFLGEHRKNPDRNALAAFLKMVEEGRIPEGSYFIIENLDRLSREDIKPALSMLLTLSDKVNIVQLKPVEQVFGKKVDPMQLMMAIMELSRGHSESAMKSVRVGDNWEESRKEAREKGTPLPGRTPAWIERVGDKYWLVPEAAEAVRLIFRLARAGYGAPRIVKELLRQNVKAIGRSGRWNSSYVRQILDNEATYGLFQFERGRKAEGEPIPGYYPAVITEEEFLAVRAVRGNPKNSRRGGHKRVYLFNHLLRDGLTADTFCVHRHSANNKLTFVPASYKRGDSSGMTSFPLEPFERAMFKTILEIDPREILPGGSEGQDKVLSLSGRLAAVEGKIAELTDALEEGDVAAVVKLLRKKEEEQRQLAAELAAARQEASSPKVEAWANCQSLISVLDTAQDVTDARLRLRSVVGRILSKIVVLFVGHRKWRLAFVQIHFADSHAFREVVIRYHGGYNTFQGVRPERLEVDTWKVRPIPENEMHVYADDVLAFLKEQADEIDKSELKRWPKRNR